MSQPTVCCVMLTRDRPELAARAIGCFSAQTYAPKRLVILDSGNQNVAKWAREVAGVIHDWRPQLAKESWSIGRLRNFSNSYCTDVQADIIIHWDDDDYSHPQRIAEQVALLQASGAECVGYRELLFWRSDGPRWPKGCTLPDADEELIEKREAWLYSVPNPSWAVGASFCYWRRTWESAQFPDLPRPGVANGSSEDVVWRRGVKCVGVSSLAEEQPAIGLACQGVYTVPRLICRIHGGNTQKYEPERYPDTWCRAPEWDAHCREVCG